eukprot:gene11984-8557_t
MATNEEPLSSGDALGALLEECRAAGAVFSEKVAFQLSEDAGVGVFAKDRVARGEVLMSVPYSLCISARAVSEHELLKEIFVDNPGLLNYPDEVLALGLIYAMKYNEAHPHELTVSAACPWALHVKTMPMTFNTPLYWAEPELERLRGHNIYHLTRMLKRQMLEDFRSIIAPIASNYPALFAGDGPVELDHYVWALSVVYSRALELERRGEVERCVVPVLDMVNHHPFLGLEPPATAAAADGAADGASVFQLATALGGAAAARDTFHYDEATDAMQLLAGREYCGALAAATSDASQWEEVFAVYGAYSDAKLLYSYGFVLPQGLNPFGGVDVYTKLQPTARAFERKQRVIDAVAGLRALGSRYDFVGTVQRGGAVAEELLGYVRVLQATDADLDELEQRLRMANATNTPRSVAAIAQAPLSPANEAATLRSLTELLLARARVEAAQEETRRLGELLLDEAVSAQDRELLALSVQCADRALLLAAVDRLRERLAALEQR